jgi:allantoinase
MPDEEPKMLYRGGQVVAHDGVRVLDVRVNDGQITEIGTALPLGGDRVVDLGGVHLLPGAIDPHGHQWEPGFTPAADFLDVTASAAVGGVTTLLDHPLTTPVVVDRETFDAKAELGERTSMIDFGLHGGAAPDHLDDLPALWAAGATGIKLFTCRTGTPLDGFDDPGRLDAVFRRLGSIDALALVHAEDAASLDRRRAELDADGGGGVADFDSWHSVEAEETAVERVLALAARTGTRTYLVHASHPGIVDRAEAAKERGVNVWVETCPHYLHLTDADLRAGGGWLMTAPPVRDATARSGLRERLADGTIDTIGSDHCAISDAGKSGDRMEAIIPGVPGLDVYLPLLLDLVAEGAIDLPRVADVTASAPARIFGLPMKGAIEVGRDADFVTVDLAATLTIRAKDLGCSAGWSPYEGRTLRGTVVDVWSRGERIVHEGRLEAGPGRGRFVRRSEEQ